MNARRTRIFVMVAVAYGLMVGAWVMASRPFTGPDEPAHYLRALNLSHGHLLGPRAPFPFAELQPALNARERAWAAQDSRAVSVPARLSPPNGLCVGGGRDTHGECVQATYTGDYAPLPYLLPAVALKISSDTGSASWLTRAASALPAAALLILALALLWDGSLWSLLGAAVAFTPMVMFVTSVLNPSGLEIAASAAFLAGLLRLARPSTERPRWLWPSLGLSGVLAVLAWQLGPLFVAFDAVVCSVLVGLPGLRRLVQPNRRGMTLAVSAIALSGVLYVAYASAAGSTHATIGLGSAGNLHAGVDQLRRVLRQAIGSFGALTVPLPRPAIYLWWALTVLLVAVALAVATRRERGALLGTCVLALLIPVVFYAVVYRHTGFGLQGRYMLPVLMAIPLLAGEIVRSHGDQSSSRIRALAPGLVSAVAVLQLVAWWVNARAAAGRPNAIWFAGHSLWSPPLGWWPWMLGAVAAAGILLSSPWLELRARVTHAPET